MTGASKVGAQSRAKQPGNGLGTTNIDILLSPKRREVQRPLFITSPPPLAGPEDEGFGADDNDGAANGDNMKKVSEQAGQGKGKEKATSYESKDLDDFEDDSMDFDPKFLEGLDTIEKEAYNRMTAPPPSSALPSTSGSSDTSTTALPSTGKSTIQAVEVITIEDEDGDAEDKENVPVPTRHVRRRTEDDGRGGLGARVLNGSQRSRDPGRPTILAKTASAVIDLSDSD
jgi:RecQ-mediated genome instability protein 1